MAPPTVIGAGRRYVTVRPMTWRERLQADEGRVRGAPR